MVLEEIVLPLVKWYRDNKRILPWRDKDNAYYTWVSEIMLQQTRVEAVKPYFRRFITELPDIQSLAECPEEKLLKLWEGLGYYNRVRKFKWHFCRINCWICINRKKTINTDIIHIKVQLIQKTDKLGTGNVRNSVIVLDQPSYLTYY